MTFATRLLAAPLAALTLLAGPATAEDGVTQFTLDNGMDVLVIEDHRSPAVVHMVWYRVGAADEPAGLSGIAHYLEHLMFKGTDDMAAGEFSETVRANGGSDNAFTSWDYTGYFQRVAADLLPRMMEMEADRMTDLILTDEVALPERSVILEERAQRIDSDPGALFREQTRAAQYLHHPYGLPIIGWRHEMEQLSTDDALDFYREFYAPNNAILIVAGDVTPDEVRALAQEYYGPIPANPDLTPRARVTEPPQTAARRVVFEDPRVAQPYVTRSYLAPERNPGDQDRAAALTLLADLLSDGPNSFLQRRLQFDTQTALYAGAWYGATSLDATTFNLTVVPAEGVSLSEAEAALDTALADFVVGGVDAEKLTRLKRQYAAQSVYEMDSTQSRARKYGAALTSGLTVADVQAWPDVLQAVTEDDILAAARAVLVPETSVTGWLRAPEGTTPEVTQ
jgi:zinc protease